MSQIAPEMNKEELLSEWQESLTELFSQVTDWAQAKEGWIIKEQSKEIREELLGAYTAPVLSITTADAELSFEPIARVVFGGQGTVELTVWPSLLRVRLIRQSKEKGKLITKPDDAKWVVLLEGIRWPSDWGEETFYKLVESLIEAQSDIDSE